MTEKMTYDTINDAVTMAGSERALLANRYHIVRQLGQGGMGSVWLAEDTQLDNKQFAIKMLPSILVSNKRAYQQLKAEALVAMKLGHSNIVQIRAFEENNGNPFLVMDYIDGQTLDDYLSEKGKLSEGETVKLLKPIAAALDYAHTKGVVHRDVKPGNVMIAKDGTPYVLDFGIAREIQETMTRVTGKLSSGTLLYMSPEQLNGASPTKEQDIYSFAAMVYECLKGEPPFVRGAIEDQIKNRRPEPLSGMGAISLSAMEGLAKNPADRPSTCAAILNGISHDCSRSVKWSYALGVILLITLFAGGGYYGWLKYDKLVKEQAEQAATEAKEEAAKAEQERKDRETQEREAQSAAAAKAKEEAAKAEQARKEKEAEEAAAKAAEQARKDREAQAAAEVKAREEAEKAEQARKEKETKDREAARRKAFLAELSDKGFILDSEKNKIKEGREGRLSLGRGVFVDMVWCPPGWFMMGSPEGEEGRKDGEDRHAVQLTKGFWIGKYEITETQWGEVMLDGSSGRKPIREVSWKDCKEFVNRLNANGGVTRARLPTEAEWEYACRAGQQTPFSFGSRNDGEFLDGTQAACAGKNTYPMRRKTLLGGNNAWGVDAVGSYRAFANNWGINDMHGNVYEWCEDVYAPYPSSADVVVDPISTSGFSSDARVIRGGCWHHPAKTCRSAFRTSKAAGDKDSLTGFRIVCDNLP